MQALTNYSLLHPIFTNIYSMYIQIDNADIITQELKV